MAAFGEPYLSYNISAPPITYLHIRADSPCVVSELIVMELNVLCVELAGVGVPFLCFRNAASRGLRLLPPEEAKTGVHRSERSGARVACVAGLFHVRLCSTTM
jgi:hypothetical protein